MNMEQILLIVFAIIGGLFSVLILSLMTSELIKSFKDTKRTKFLKDIYQVAYQLKEEKKSDAEDNLETLITELEVNMQQYWNVNEHTDELCETTRTIIEKFKEKR